MDYKHINKVSIKRNEIKKSQKEQNEKKEADELKIQQKIQAEKDRKSVV